MCLHTCIILLDKKKIMILFYMFQSEFLDPLSSLSVGYKSQSNDANDSKKEDISQLFCYLIEHIEATRINQLL